MCPGVQLVIGNRRGDGLGGSALRRRGQLASAAVEQAAEDAGEGEHVVDLVRLVAAAGGHHGRVPPRNVRVDFRVRVGQGEDNGPVGHRGSRSVTPA
jgi:hypothetical protein